MAEEYQFLRYYLPGSLFLFYVAILLVPNSSVYSSIVSSDGTLSLGINLVGLLVSLIGVSPIIGFIIYAFYNPYYERRAVASDRGAFEYLKTEKFTKNTKIKAELILSSDKQRKEFLDLVVHTKGIGSNLEVDSDIRDLMKGHLSKYAARIVCGFYVPIFSTIVVLTLFLIGVFSPTTLSFNWQPHFLIPAALLISFLSIRFLRDNERVIQEAFILEEYLVKAKEKAVMELLEKISAESAVNFDNAHPNIWKLARLVAG